ncbi:MAG TPA: zinc-ribbon and DUF3426 domain-containing protein [Steroidobacteraceae bacterium]|nr:zinc-ribbon and DUF3426 domain-containing protein [Steroidobacteraceae bacterium]HRX90879.1 zinc-ribbon and DUF3426 domain-containing protein [Steroidobacteraceae bacterium]
MFTTCPKCDLTLVVTAHDLRAGQGYVRCGRCASVFNALINLSEDRLPGPVGEPVSAPALEPVAQPASETDDALEFKPQRAQVADIFIAPSTDTSDISSGTFESIVLEGGLDDDQADAETTAGTEPEPQSEPDDAAPPPIAAANEPDDDEDDPESKAAFQRSLESLLVPADERGPTDHAVASVAAAPAASHRRTIHPALATAIAVEPTAPAFPDAEAVAEGYFARQLSARLRRLSVIGSVVLGVLLLAQLVHVSRYELASSGFWSGPIIALYGAFGAKLEPRWNVTAYEVRQLGAETLPGDASRLLVRASIRNTAARAMPLPRLRLTLQDRYGNPVSTRDLEPSEYLPAPLKDTSEIAADQRIDTDIRVVDPGRAAMGFEIDACLPNRNDTVRCANDERRRVAASS